MADPTGLAVASVADADLIDADLLDADLLDADFLDAELVDAEVIDPIALQVLTDRVAQDQAAPNARRAYAATYRQLETLLALRLGRAPTPADLIPETVVALRDALEAAGRQPTTIARHLAALRQFLDAAGAGLRRSEAVALDLDDVVEVRRFADPRLRPAVAPRNADQTNHALAVRRSKRGRSRQIPLSRPALDALRDWCAHRPATPATALLVSLPRRCGEAPAALNPDAIGDVVVKYATVAGVPVDRRTRTCSGTPCSPPAARHWRAHRP